jgi:voltage-gated potassium channel
MTFVTVATIGFHEIVDLQGNTAGRLFTIAISLAGIGTMAYVFSTATALILETKLSQALRRRHMHAEIADLQGHYIVCGGGRIGGYVMDELRAHGRPFVLVEANREALERLHEGIPHLLAVEGDASDDDVLERAGIARAAGVFAVTGDDAKNLVVSLSSKQLNPLVRVIARVHDKRNAAKTLRAGADEIVSPEYSGGHRIASLMIRPHMVSLMDELVRSGSALTVEEVPVPARPFPLKVEALGHSPDWLLVAIRQGGNWRFNPPDDALIGSGDALVVIANPQGRSQLQALVLR